MRADPANYSDSSANNSAAVKMMPLLIWKHLQTDAVRDMLIEPNGMLTFGSEERDIDWEKEWRSRLQADKPVRSGTARLSSHGFDDLSDIGEPSIPAPSSFGLLFQKLWNNNGTSPQRATADFGRER